MYFLPGEVSVQMETCIHEITREYLWVVMYAPDGYDHRWAEAEVTKNPSSQDIGLPGGSEICSGSGRMVSGENTNGAGEGMC